MKDIAYHSPIEKSESVQSTLLSVLSIQGVTNKIKRCINDYLKTPQEIESELCIALIGEQNFLDLDDALNRQTDGYIHIEGTDILLSGPLEENY